MAMGAVLSFADAAEVRRESSQRGWTGTTTVRGVSITVSLSAEVAGGLAHKPGCAGGAVEEDGTVPLP